MSHSPCKNLLSSLFAAGLLLTFPQPPLHAQSAIGPDAIIPEFGKYSKDYLGDWSTLRSGRQLAQHDPAAIHFQDVTGEDVRREWHNQDEVVIKDLSYRIHWKAGASNKYGTTLLYIENVKRVVIENLNIVQTDKNYVGYHDILIEGADSVYIKNLYLAGADESSHLRIEGCHDVFVENVEVAGIDYEGKGDKRTGAGIWLNNGADRKGGLNNTGTFAKNPRLPGWQVIQNCYFHDATGYDGKWRNLDAVLIHSAGNGLLFNCVVENWLVNSADASFDLSFRRSDPDFQGRFLRVERNAFYNCSHFKNVGKSGPTNSMLIANNLFVNTQIADYHAVFPVVYAQNTFVADIAKAGIYTDTARNRALSGFMCLWSFYGPTRLANNLVYSEQSPYFVYYADAQASPDKYLQVTSDHNIYALKTEKLAWLKSAVQGYSLPTFEAWKAKTSQDRASLLENPVPGCFSDYVYGNYCPVKNLPDKGWEEVATTEFLEARDVKMRIDRDFYGRPRSASSLLPGAFNAGGDANNP